MALEVWNTILRAWDDLEPAIAAMRERFDPAAFENFEYMAVRARLWQERYPDGAHPAGQPRMADLKRTPSAPPAL